MMILNKESVYSGEYLREATNYIQYLDIRYLLMCLVLITTGNFILNIVLVLKIIWGVN